MSNGEAKSNSVWWISVSISPEVENMRRGSDDPVSPADKVRVSPEVNTKYADEWLFPDPERS
jgi:hypothetical protein